MKKWLRRWFGSTNHKDIGTLYLIFSLISGMLGTGLSFLIRLQLSNSGNILFLENWQAYNAMVTAHALVMIFFMVMPVLIGSAEVWNNLLKGYLQTKGSHIVIKILLLVSIIFSGYLLLFDTETVYNVISLTFIIIFSLMSKFIGLLLNLDFMLNLLYFIAICSCFICAVWLILVTGAISEIFNHRIQYLVLGELFIPMAQIHGIYIRVSLKAITDKTEGLIFMVEQFPINYLYLAAKSILKRHGFLIYVFCLMLISMCGFLCLFGNAYLGNVFMHMMHQSPWLAVNPTQEKVRTCAHRNFWVDFCKDILQIEQLEGKQKKIYTLSNLSSNETWKKFRNQLNSINFFEALILLHGNSNKIFLDTQLAPIAKGVLDWMTEHPKCSSSEFSKWFITYSANIVDNPDMNTWTHERQVWETTFSYLLNVKEVDMNVLVTEFEVLSHLCRKLSTRGFQLIMRADILDFVHFDQFCIFFDNNPKQISFEAALLGIKNFTESQTSFWRLFSNYDVENWQKDYRNYIFFFTHNTTGGVRMLTPNELHLKFRMLIEFIIRIEGRLPIITFHYFKPLAELVRLDRDAIFYPYYPSIFNPDEVTMRFFNIK